MRYLWTAFITPTWSQLNEHAGTRKGDCRAPWLHVVRHYGLEGSDSVMCPDSRAASGEKTANRGCEVIMWEITVRLLQCSHIAVCAYAFVSSDTAQFQREREIHLDTWEWLHVKNDKRLVEGSYQYLQHHSVSLAYLWKIWTSGWVTKQNVVVALWHGMHTVHTSLWMPNGTLFFI